PSQASPIPSQEDDSVNLIAYVGPDDNIYTIRPDGSNPELLTIPTSGVTASLSGAGLFNSHTIYNWPTWSPDATKIAFTSYAENSDIAGSLWVAHIPGGLPEKIFQDPPEAAGRFVAPRSPHYIYWAPDSETIAFLAPTSESLVLYLIDDEGLQDPRLVARGAPSYISWSPDGHRLLHHLQGTLSLVDTRGELSVSTFAFQSVAFRAPSWAPDGKRIAYVDRLNGVDSLVITNLDGGAPLRVAPISNLGVFLWSPVANEIAFTQISTAANLGTPTYDGLVVFDADTRETRRISSVEIAAFFWSPDGSKLAYVSIDRATATISWYVNDRLGNSERKLADFVPSREQLFTMFSFFDQYAYSNSLWSPDSRSLVYVGREPSSNGSGADTVFVLPVDGSSPARPIAPGNLAFWSPR
ncbi:MAG: hypothetical protein V3U79_07920, partial [Dehalococcoidia bacterium]